MAKTGQRDRLHRHFGAYLDAGHDLAYFSSLPLDEHWKGVTMVRPRRPVGWRRALLRGAVDRRLRDCDLLRCTSLLGTLSAIPAKLLHGVPFVVTLGADYPAIAKVHGRAVWKWRVLQTLALKYAAAVIVPNPVMAEALRANHPNVVHVPNWVDTDLFRPDDRSPNPRKIVLYVGRLVQEKNLLPLARACRTLDVTLVCVGAGPLQESLRAEGAHCCGPLPWRHLPAMYTTADVFCLPSFTEGHPKALLEAMACGLPCVVSNTVPGAADLAGALMVDPHHAGSIAAGLRVMLTDPEVAASLGRRARRRALRYDYRKVLPQEIAVIEGCA